MLRRSLIKTQVCQNLRPGCRTIDASVDHVRVFNTCYRLEFTATLVAFLCPKAAPSIPNTLFSRRAHPRRPRLAVGAGLARWFMLNRLCRYHFYAQLAVGRMRTRENTPWNLSRAPPSFHPRFRYECCQSAGAFSAPSQLWQVILKSHWCTTSSLSHSGWLRTLKQNHLVRIVLNSAVLSQCKTRYLLHYSRSGALKRPLYIHKSHQSNQEDSDTLGCKIWHAD